MCSCSRMSAAKISARLMIHFPTLFLFESIFMRLYGVTVVLFLRSYLHLLRADLSQR